MNFPTKRSKYGNHKTVAYGRKFDSTAEVEYYPIAVAYAEEHGYRLELQYKLEIIPSLRINSYPIRKTQYIADYAFLDIEGTLLRLIDVKGVETKDFRLKAKMIAKEYGLVIELAKKTRSGFVHYPFNTTKNKRLEIAHGTIRQGTFQIPNGSSWLLH